MQTLLIRKYLSAKRLAQGSDLAGREGRVPYAALSESLSQEMLSAGSGSLSVGRPRGRNAIFSDDPASLFSSPLGREGSGGCKGLGGPPARASRPPHRVRRGERRGGEGRAELNAGIQQKRHEKCLDKLCRGISGFLSSN